MLNLSNLATVRVSLTEAQILGGTGKEYPNGEPGTVLLEKSCLSEGLVYVRFPRPFIANGVRKTDHQHGMLVPKWCLIPRRPLI